MPDLDTCRWCGGAHPIEFCPDVLAAFDPRVRPDRVARVPGSARPCARCGGGPRVTKLAYCRACKTEIDRASWERRKARAQGVAA